MDSKKAHLAPKVFEGKGGTVIWCPDCRAWRPCKSIPVPVITEEKKHYNPRWHVPAYPDICWFMRGRQCQQCGIQFLTAELDLFLVEELVKQRDKLDDVKLMVLDLIARGLFAEPV